MVTCHAFGVGGSVEGVVVQQKRHAILAELDITLEHAVAMAGADAQGGEGVFRGEFSSATVGDPFWIWPFECGDLLHDLIILNVRYPFPCFSIKLMQAISPWRGVNRAAS